MVSCPARPLPKLARYQTALRPALSILRLLARSPLSRNTAKCEHTGKIETNFDTNTSQRRMQAFALRAYKQNGPMAEDDEV